MNVIVYILQGINVKKFDQSKFSELKNTTNPDTEDTICSLYYYDWQHLMIKAQVYVSYVLNLQNWVRISVFMLVLLISYNTYKDNVTKTPGFNNSNLNIMTVNVADLDNYFTESSINLTKLELRIQEGEVKRLYILTPNNLITSRRVNSIISECKDIVDVKFVIDASTSTEEIKILEDQQ